MISLFSDLFSSRKEELENYKKEPKPDDLIDSDVLQMLKKTSLQDANNNGPTGLTGRMLYLVEYLCLTLS